jgi:hypothetical protein
MVEQNSRSASKATGSPLLMLENCASRRSCAAQGQRDMRARARRRPARSQPESGARRDRRAAGRPKLLRGRGSRRQERRQIRDVVRARHDDAARARQPSQSATVPGTPTVHGAAGARKVISERSPSVWRISTLNNWSSRRRFALRLHGAQQLMVQGNRVRLQRSTLPAKST